MARWQLFGKGVPTPSVDTVAVIGMGRFGQALAHELTELGVDVLAIDVSEETIQSLSDAVTYAVVADGTKEAVLRQLAVNELPCVVVAVGSNVEASILTTSLLIKFGVKQIWAKAASDAHVEILRQLGVEHIVYPEHEMGQRVAHVLRGSLNDYLEIGDGLALVRTSPPPFATGKPLRELHVKSRYGVRIVCHKPAGGTWRDAGGDTVLSSTDQILITGNSKNVENFHSLR